MKTITTLNVHHVKWYVFIAFISVAQIARAQYEKEINNQVWKPFIASFNEFNTDKFMALHSKELVRSSRDSKSILDWVQYDQQQREGDKRSKADKHQRRLELRFTERLSNANQAIDIGIYKTTSTNSKGESRSFYGRFHVVLRKENNVWKILIDTDSSENNTIKEADFNIASTLE